MSNLSEAEIEMRIKRQQTLLKERKAEYEVFGATPADIQKDRDIMMEIKILQAQLMTNLEDMDNREIRAAHEFAVKRIELELLNGEVPEKLWSQLGKVCFEVMQRQMTEEEFGK